MKQQVRLLRSWITLTGLVFIMLSTAHAQSLSGIHVGDSYSNVQQIIGFPSSRSERSGPFSVAKWLLGDGNSLSVTARSDTGKIVYIESDWGGNTTYTDFPNLHFGKTTLADIKQKFGSDNFGWYGGPMPDRSIVMQNSYRISPGNVIITFTTKISPAQATQNKVKGSSDPSNLLKLVAISLSTQEYLASIWGTEHLPGESRRNIDLALLQNRDKNPASIKSSADLEVNLRQDGGTFLVPVKINGKLSIDFLLDTGASDVQIPADVLMTLYRTGTVSDTDFLGTQTYTLADGSTVPSPRFKLQTLEVGGRAVHDVVASVGSVKSTPLLGQSFLSKLGSWTLDNERHVLVLPEKP
jgi:clan AA aspartic protease (TIGR02281 family)